MKCSPDLDLYVMWSSIVDNAVWVGSRAEALHLPEFDEERLVRTDKTGTSTLRGVRGYPLAGSWDNPTILVRETVRQDEGVYAYTLRRTDLAAYAETLDVDDVEAEALLTPVRFCSVCDTDRDIDPATSLCPAHANAR